MRNDINQPKLWHGHEIRYLIGELVSNQGIPLEQLLKGSHLLAEDFANPALRLTVEQELYLYIRVANFNQDKFLALRHGAKMGVLDYGILGSAMNSSETIRDALKLLGKLGKLFSFQARYEFYEEVSPAHKYGCMKMWASPTDLITEKFEIESTFASFKHVIEEMIDSRISCETVTFSYSEDRNKQLYSDYFGCTIAYDQPENCLVFSREILDKQIQYSDPTYLARFESLCEMKLQELRSHNLISTQVKNLILQQKKMMPTIEDVSDLFFVSSRSLRRKLKADGVSYREIVDEVRNEKAQSLLRNTTQTISSIAFSLGYSDVANFRVAFRRWSGMSPQQYRTQNG
jgi:AraC-like DNA-binding protein